jgi:hypothetical protein
MVHYRLVRVHDAAGKEVINERLIRREPCIAFRGIYDALELDRPLLEVKLCMLADTPIARATSIPNSDIDEAVDTIVQSLAQVNIPDPMVYVFIQQAPSGLEGKVFASYEQLKGYQPDYSHAPSFLRGPRLLKGCWRCDVDHSNVVVVMDGNVGAVYDLGKALTASRNMWGR